MQAARQLSAVRALEEHVGEVVRMPHWVRSLVLSTEPLNCAERVALSVCLLANGLSPTLLVEFLIGAGLLRDQRARDDVCALLRDFRAGKRTWYMTWSLTLQEPTPLDAPPSPVMADEFWAPAFALLDGEVRAPSEPNTVTQRGRLTVEQREQIEANRQAALLRREETAMVRALLETEMEVERRAADKAKVEAESDKVPELHEDEDESSESEDSADDAESILYTDEKPSEVESDDDSDGDDSFIDDRSIGDISLIDDDAILDDHSCPSDDDWWASSDEEKLSLDQMLAASRDNDQSSAASSPLPKRRRRFKLVVMSSDDDDDEHSS